MGRTSRVTGGTTRSERLQAWMDELLQLYSTEYGCEVPPLKVVLSKRRTKRWRGCYDARKATITIYDHGGNDEEMNRTLLHEIAHHLQHTINAVDAGKVLARPGKPHGVAFELHYHSLVTLAREKGYYADSYVTDPVLKSLLTECQTLKKGTGESALKKGELLRKARDRCRDTGASFELFIKEGCGFDRSLAYDYIRAWEIGLPTDLGVAKMRFVLRTPAGLRDQVIEDVRRGVPERILRLRYRPDLAPKSLAPEEIERDPVQEIQRLKARERSLFQELHRVKDQRIALEIRAAPANMEGTSMSNNSTLFPQTQAADILMVTPARDHDYPTLEDSNDTVSLLPGGLSQHGVEPMPGRLPRTGGGEGI